MILEVFLSCIRPNRRTVCLLSIMHQSPEVDQPTQKKKPEMILFHTKNKVGVDYFDQMVRLHAKWTASRRWPMSVRGNMLDTAAINAWILYKNATQQQISLRNFILLLVKNLQTGWKKMAPTVSLLEADQPALRLKSVAIVMEKIATT